MIKKNEIYEVEIIDNGINAEGICKVEDLTIFVPGTIKGEIVKIQILKVNVSYAFAKAIEIITPSIHRIEPLCDSAESCGGCAMHHINYDYQIEMKTNMIINNFKKFNIEAQINPCIGLGIHTHYRNKGQFPIKFNKENVAISGLYKERSHDIVEFDTCFLQDKISNIILKKVIGYINKNKLSVYSEATHSGLIRHLVTRVGFHTNEIMVILVCNDIRKDKKTKDILKGFSDYLILEFPNITTIVENINTDKSNLILGQTNINLFGEGIIHESIGEYTFQISPLSFFQVNSKQVELLYSIVKDFAALKDTDIVFDLYCGAGTIGIFLSKEAKKIYSIDIIPEAIEDAKINAKLNGIKNISFFAGDTEVEVKKLMDKNVKPNVVVVDPPRKGLSPNTIELLKEINADKIVYVSCNSATLVRDLSLLKDEYTISEVTPVDMFPYTVHTESVTVMKRK